MGDMEELHRALGRIEGKLDQKEKNDNQRFDAIDERLDGVSRAKARIEQRLDAAETALTDHNGSPEAHGAGAVKRTTEHWTSWGALLIAVVSLWYTLLGKENPHDRQAQAQEIPGRAAGKALSTGG